MSENLPAIQRPPKRETGEQQVLSTTPTMETVEDLIRNDINTLTKFLFNALDNRAIDYATYNQLATDIQMVRKAPYADQRTIDASDSDIEETRQRIIATLEGMPGSEAAIANFNQFCSKPN